MGFFDRLFGTDQTTRTAQRSEDEIAIERYRYLLKTAPPETIEQVHREAFAKLTPDQRQLLFDGLTENAPAGDAPKSPEPAALAASATRSELRTPGVLERTMGSSALGGGGMGFGSMFASSLLGSVAGYVIGSALVGTFMNGFDDSGTTDAANDTSDTDAGTDTSTDTSTDASAADYDSSGGSDFGSDFGGGDFGGGDFF
jgi:hypothetical protein